MAKRPSQAKSANKNAARKQHEKDIKAQRAAEDRELKSFLRVSQGLGIYDIKRPVGVPLSKVKLSRGQRSRARKAMNEFGDFFDPAKFTLLIPEKKARKRVRERAESLGLKQTKIGFFAPKEGYQKVSLGHDKKRDEYFIKKSGKTKRGQNKGKRYSVITPLASADELDEERDRLIHLAKRFKLKDQERLAFEVRENGYTGYSHATFNSLDALMDYLDRYQKSVAGRTHFYRHIHIVKTKTFKEWFEKHPIKARVGGFGKSIYARSSTDKGLKKKGR